MQEESDIISGLSVLQSQAHNIHNLINLHRDRFGVLECLSILRYHMNIVELDRKYRDLQASMSAAGIHNKPLDTVITRDGVKYNIFIARMDKVVTGEYETIDELITKIEPEKVPLLEGNLEFIEERLLANSVSMFNSLNTSAKSSQFGSKFKGMITSKKRRYLYHYLPDKKRVLGIIAVRAKN